MCSFGWLFYVLLITYEPCQSCWHQRLFGWNDCSSCFCAGNTVYQPVTVVTPQGQVVTQAISPGTIHIQNSQVCRAHTNTFTHRSQAVSLIRVSFYFLQLQLQLNQDLSFFGGDDNSPKNKRGVLPKQATSVMRSWLFQHIAVSWQTNI